MKKHLLLTFLAVLSLQFNSHAQTTTTVEQWTFDGANPETGINGTIASTWTTASPNSVPSVGVLRYATSGQAAWKGLPSGGVDTSTIETLRLTVEVTDMYIAGGDQIRFFFPASGGGSGHLESKLTSWGSGQFAPDILVGSTKMLDANTDISFAAPSTGLGSALTIVTTWDFLNDTVSFDLSGPGAVGLGTTSWTASAGVDLSANVGTVQAIQMKTSSTFTSWMNLDTVTIETISSSLSTPETVLDNAKVWYSNSANALHIEGVTANSVRVYALSGAKVAQYDNPGNTIALGDLSSGLYIASVLSEHGTKAFKFVK